MNESTCLICKKPAITSYPPDEEEKNSCGSFTCEYQIQSAIDNAAEHDGG